LTELGQHGISCVRKKCRPTSAGLLEIPGVAKLAKQIRSQPIIDLEFRVGQFADEDVAGGVDAAFGIVAEDGNS
jgi:hypothetical protein